MLPLVPYLEALTNAASIEQLWSLHAR